MTVDVPVSEPKSFHNGIRQQHPAYTWNFAILDETALLANADERGNIVEEIDKQKREKYLQETQMQRSSKIQLKKGRGGVRHRKKCGRPAGNSAQHPEHGRSNDADQNRAMDFPRHQNQRQSKPEARGLHFFVREAAEANERGRVRDDELGINQQTR